MANNHAASHGSGAGDAVTLAMAQISDLPTLTITNYTPTISAAVNCDSTPSIADPRYFRIGNLVVVFGRFAADPTLTATATSFEISLPIASNLTLGRHLAGVAFCGQIAGMGASIQAETTNDTASVQWIASDVATQNWSFIFCYEIL